MIWSIVCRRHTTAGQGSNAAYRVAEGRTVRGIPMRKVALIVALTLGLCTSALAQQLPSGLVSVGVPSLLVSGLPTCNAAAGPLLYQVTDSLNACTFGNAVTGGGGLTCPVQCDAATATWRMAQPPDIAPPTTINVLTGTGGGYTNCVSGGTTTGCATGNAMVIFSGATITTTDYTVVGTFQSALSGTQVGWNYSVVQKNAVNSSSNGYTGCSSIGTILSVQSATKFTGNTPASHTGTCGSGFGNLADTGATVVIWDGKDTPGIAAANTAAHNLATTYNSAGNEYIPYGIYVVGGTGFSTTTLQPASDTKVQCQGPVPPGIVPTGTNGTMIINPYYDSTSNVSVYEGGGTTQINNVTIEGCTFAGLNSAPYRYDSGREFDNWVSTGGGLNWHFLGNVFEYTWGDQGMNIQRAQTSVGSPPCALGFAQDSATHCVVVPTNWEIDRNAFYGGVGIAIQIDSSVGLQVHDNTFVDTNPSYESGTSTDTIYTSSGNDIHDNDVYCDAAGSGSYQGYVAFNSSTATPYTGCVLQSTDDALTLNLSGDGYYNNHVHSLTAHPNAGCGWGGSGTKPRMFGNTCISGENCSVFSFVGWTC